MTSAGNSLDDFPENQLTKFRAVVSVKANRDHAFFFHSKIFLYREYKQFKHINGENKKIK